MKTASKKADELLQAIRQGAEPAFAHCVDSLQEIFPLLNRYKATPQDAEWHAEGDVYIHTEMVLQALYEEMKGLELTGNERLTLVLGAILHDVAKPLTTREKEMDGLLRVVSPRHEQRGRSLIHQPLLDLGLEYSLIREVMGLVGYHQMPKLLIVKNRPESAFFHLARLAPLHLLYILERADIRGRICPDPDDQLLWLDLFRDEAQRLGLWRTEAYSAWKGVFTAAMDRRMPPRFLDFSLGAAIQSYESGVISMPEEGVSRSYGLRQGFGELIILCGVSGSGKSSWARRVYPDAQMISLDELRHSLAGKTADQSMNGEVLQRARRLLKEGLAAHRQVVWDATNLRVDFRAQLIGIARDYAALTTLVCFAIPSEILIARNRMREDAVAYSVQLDQMDRCEWPEEDEAHRYVVVGPEAQVLHAAGFFGKEGDYGS